MMIYLQVFTAVAPQAMCAYARACISTVLRSEGGHKALLFGGGSIQCGAFFGGLVGFLVVSVFQVFEQELPCSHLSPP
jgi:riboflavin transporter 2